MKEPAERLAFDPGGQLDDLSLSGDLIDCLRLERIGDRLLWGYIYFRDGRRLRLSVGTVADMKVRADWELAERPGADVLPFPSPRHREDTCPECGVYPLDLHKPDCPTLTPRPGH